MRNSHAVWSQCALQHTKQKAINFHTWNAKMECQSKLPIVRATCAPVKIRHTPQQFPGEHG